MDTLIESEATYLVCTYDLTVNPLSFDFSCFLAISICESRRRGFGGKIFVVVLADGFRNVAVEGLYTPTYQQRRVKNILVPLISMCSFCVGYLVSTDLDSITDFFVGASYKSFFPVGANHFTQRKNQAAPQWQLTPMVPRQLEAYVTHGFYPEEPIFQPAPDYVNYFEGLFGANTILLHPRCSPYNSDRNTPKELFDQVSAGLAEYGFRTEIIRDVDETLTTTTAGLDQALSAATFSVEVRLAAALAAANNVTWSTGVVSPFYYSLATFHMFGFLRERGAISNTRFFERKGPTPNQNPRWLRDNQKFDWRDADNLDADYIIKKVIEQTRDALR